MFEEIDGLESIGVHHKKLGREVSGEVHHLLFLSKIDQYDS